MTLLERHKRISLLLLFVPGTFIWMVMLFFSTRFPYTFYFESTIEQHQLWFPRFYLFTFLSFRLFIPFIYCMWLAGWLLYKEIKSMPFWLFTSVIVFFLTLGIQQNYGFVATCYWGIPLYASGCFIFLQNYKVTWIWQPSLTTPKLIIERGGIFIVYFVLCIFLPRFHPFAKYTMFSHFSDTTFVYIFRDKNGTLIPIQQYSSLTYDELFTIGETITQSKTNGVISDSVLGVKLLTHFKKNRNFKKIPTDSISFNKVSFNIKENSIIKNEKIIGVYDAKQFVF